MKDTASRPDTAAAILRISPLGFPWVTADPFLFCAHHDDAYPAADGRMGPGSSLEGRDIGQDFSRKDGWSMYHGERVPGFPAHPHRGFETVTIVRKGLIDHSDSLGAAARFGQGDVQWLTAGQGIVHAEMFPLLREDRPNPVELFQIWLNLPARSKMAAPHFRMFWSHQVPHLQVRDDAGSATEVAVISGRLDGAAAPPPPPPDSWAARADADVAIWTIRMEPGARWTLPAAEPSARPPEGGLGLAGRSTQGRGCADEPSRRHLYFFRGSKAVIAGETIVDSSAVELRADRNVELRNGGDDIAEFLLLQGRPIGEPVAQYGPFVMNNETEIRQTLIDYRRTQFGGWTWPDQAPVHGRDAGRFARHPDGRHEQPQD
jgi:redox-sensitive bicupin YhaK (pirin superfamily)